MKSSKTVVLMLILVLVALPYCGKKHKFGSSKDGTAGEVDISKYGIPEYPNATPDETVTAGMMGGVKRVFTTDSYDKALNYYTDKLSQYKPKKLSHKSELGRQTALSFEQNKKMVTVAIQEFTKDKNVSISYMIVGF